MPSAVSLSYLLVKLCIFFTLISRSSAAFGDAFDYGRDETFEKMGDAKIDQFIITNDDGYCTDDWKKLDSTCYFLGHSVPIIYSYSEAVTECSNRDATLAIVDSQEKQDFLSGLLNAGNNYIVGLTDIGSAGTFFWPDGSSPIFTAWDSAIGEPHSDEALNCVGMSGSAEGKWYDYFCDDAIPRGLICQRSALAGNVHLHIAFEDTQEVDELWLFDFQPFEFNDTTPVLTAGVGTLDSTKSGTCSSVFTTTTYDPTNGFYKDQFLPEPSSGSKDLYQAYVRGNTYETKGNIQVRKDLLTFDGDMETMFACENSLGENVWEQHVTDESIEFNTTLYMTNIRPVHITDDGTIAPAYIQSYISLYWRLIRTAISRILTSSVERLKPIFEYAIVSTVYRNGDEDEGVDQSRAEVEISFWTVTDTPESNTLISVYKPASLTYTPVNQNNGLAHVKEVPDGGCHDALGMENNNITEAQITTSSMLEDSNMYAGQYARLNNQPIEGISAGAWFADDVAPFIEVTFIAMTTVSGVVTQGQQSQIGDLWVKSYYVQYEVYARSSSQSSLVYVKNAAGSNEKFIANFDRDTTVTNYLPKLVRTKRLRIEPNDTSTEGFVAMRMELLGCRDELPVRLMNGGGPHEGRVEVYHDGRWGTICNDQWAANAATVVCRQLGYRYAESNPVLRSYGAGNDTDPIVLSNVLCDGREPTLASCTYGGFGVHNCNHTSDIGVLCSQDSYALGMENGDISDSQITASSSLDNDHLPPNGRLNFVPPTGSGLSGAWSAGILDINQWIQVDLGVAKEVCGVIIQGREIWDEQWVTQYRVLYRNDGTIWFNVNEVFAGNTDTTTPVTNYFQKPFSARYIRINPTQWQVHISMRFELLSCTETTLTEPSVRLVGGTYHYEGRVEIWHDNEWGTICNTGWSMNDAHIVCRELGFADAIEAVTNANDWYGEAPSDFKIWLNNVDCLGGESRVSQCTHDDWNVNSCAHTQDVGVVCTGESPEQSVDDLAVLHAPPCNYTVWPGGCTQHWLFTIVLDVDFANLGSNLEEGKPIDTSGEFEFLYYLYECPDLNDFPVSARHTCQRINVPDAMISHELTLQTTVQVADEETDQPTLQVSSVYGNDPSRDLRYNLYQPGISHLERVTVETKLFPEFLRLQLELELTLFMVCIGEYQDMPDGCLAAPGDQRYSSFTHPQFQYTMLADQNDPEGDTIDLIVDDLANDASQQDLETYQYIADQDLHRSTFINKALSGESRIYTITNVFQLVEKGTSDRRVVRRDIIDNAQAPVGLKHAFFFAGCPEYSKYNDNRECVCDEGLIYSTESFQCVPIYTEVDNNKIPEGPLDDDEDIDNVIESTLISRRKRKATAPWCCRDQVSLFLS